VRAKLTGVDGEVGQNQRVAIFDADDAKTAELK
jgi:hypothetical protein